MARFGGGFEAARSCQPCIYRLQGFGAHSLGIRRVSFRIVGSGIYVHDLLTRVGTIQRNIHWPSLRDQSFPVPPIRTQRAIANYLDRATAKIDALISEQKHFIGLLRRRRLAVLDSEFQRAEGKRSTNVRRALTKLSRPAIPGRTVITAYRDGQVTLRSKRREGGYTFSDSEAGYQGIEVDDLVFHALDGFAGAVGVSDSRGVATPVYHVCRPSAGDDVEYLALLLRYLGTSGSLAVQAPSVRQRSVDFRNWNTFARVPLALPSGIEQREFVMHFRSYDAKLSTLLAETAHNIALAMERRAALITNAVTGQLDISGAIS